MISIFIVYNKTYINKYMYLSIGDGLSLGLNPDGIKSFSYNDYLKEFFNNKNIELDYYNYSEKDISIPELTNDIIYLDNSNLKHYLTNSNLIILSIGEKELKSNKSTINIKKDLKNLIQEIKKYNNNICILSKYHIGIEKTGKIKEINNIYKEVSKEYNLIYINIEDTSYYLTNNKNIYPTSKGYEEISKLLIKAINIKDK